MGKTHRPQLPRRIGRNGAPTGAAATDMEAVRSAMINPKGNRKISFRYLQ